MQRLLETIQRVFAWIFASRRRAIRVGIIVVALVVVGLILLSARDIGEQVTDQRNQDIARWFTEGAEDNQDLVTREIAPCPDYPFLLPSYGYVGLLYGDPRGPYSERAPHQGIDIFSPGQPGDVPVFAAYDGYITRLNEWTSSLIQRVPEDPLQPDRQIWLYYTHMAPQNGQEDFISDRFPRGTSEVFVEQGELLGYQGNFSGSARPVGTHLHFSIVLDDGQGQFLNELDFNNTVDSSRYLGMRINYGCYDQIAACTPNPTCDEAVLGAGGT